MQDQPEGSFEADAGSMRQAPEIAEDRTMIVPSDMDDLSTPGTPHYSAEPDVIH